MSRLRRFVSLWRRRQLDAEFDEELAFHRDVGIARNLPSDA
jgi:hypothetical protein